MNLEEFVQQKNDSELCEAYKELQVMKETGNRGFQIMKMLMLCKTSFSCSEADMTTVENAVCCEMARRYYDIKSNN